MGCVDGWAWLNTLAVLPLLLSVGPPASSVHAVVHHLRILHVLLMDKGFTLGNEGQGHTFDFVGIDAFYQVVVGHLASRHLFNVAEGE